MKIKSLRLENFRCFKELDITFEQINTLVGENGSGKTSILDAIALALSSSFVASRIDEQDFNNDDSGDLKIEVFFDGEFIAKLPDGYAQQEIPCKGVRLIGKRRQRAAAGKALSEEFAVEHYVIPGDSVPSTEKGWTKTRGTGSEFPFSTRQLSFPLDLENYPKCFYFDRQRERESKAGFNSTLQKILADYNWRFRKNLDDKMKNDFLHQWNVIYSMILGGVDEKKLKETFEPVKTALTKFLGKSYNNLELAVLNLEQPFAKGFFALRENLNQLEQARLGTGISMVLSYFLLETISKLAKDDLIILIDEPEMHLHPQLQSKLNDHLAKGDFQVILSTHSEHMVNLNQWQTIKRLDSKYRLNPHPDNLNRKLGDTSIEAHLQEIARYRQDKTTYVRQNHELFFARKCVLVEGPVDKYAIETLSSLADVNINDLTIIPCNGKEKIPYYQLICIAFGIPFFTIHDADANTKDKEQINNRIKAGAEEKYYHCFTGSLEHLFGTQSSLRKATATIKAIDECGALPEEMKALFKGLSSFTAGV